jgi:ATP-binding cassette subfamily F protein uup
VHLLRIQDLSKRFGNKVLFDQVSFVLGPADRVGLVGVNGSGKTTLLNMIAGLEPPDAGDIDRNPKTRLDYLPQNPPMDEATPVLDYLFQGQSPTMQLLRAYEKAVLALEKSPQDAACQAELARLNQRM